jgi:hypothetical protein
MVGRGLLVLPFSLKGLVAFVVTGKAGRRSGGDGFEGLGRRRTRRCQSQLHGNDYAVR